ncbi:MJ0042-type zinc finger domain-containing protein [Tepidamorphus sp. 3E244]|uniref:MJ0042-type zinc finger domain-containing protein n=1 Tax=Tepidamorphus sp. 3E244 TaxID=3385498 RepID=UPI0038FD07CC
MIITCPNCATDYNVDHVAFPETGRTVKCARCKETWYALPTEEHPVAEEANVVADDIEQEAGEDTADVAASGPDTVQVASYEDGDDWDMAADEDAEPDVTADFDTETDAEPNLPVEYGADPMTVEGEENDLDLVDIQVPGIEAVESSDIDLEAVEIDEDDEAERDGAQIVDEAEDTDSEDVVSIEAASRARGAAARFLKKRGTSEGGSKVRVAKYAAVAAMVMLIGAGIMYREGIVRTIPSMAGLYAMAGMSINLRGLEFEDLDPEQSIEDGIPVLRIAGGIRNVTDKEVTVPPVRLSLTSIDGQEVYFWTVRPDIQRLYPGELLKFKSVLSAPPRAATGVAARFIDPDGVRVGLK